MAKAFLSYDKDLPEIPGRLPWEKPTQHLVKVEATENDWHVEEGRRESKLLLVPRLRAAVDAWRGDEQNPTYAGASEVTRRLLEYWFLEDHEVEGFPVPFHYHFGQREAIETLVWLIEIAGQRDAKALIETFGEIRQRDLVSRNVEFQTTMDGRRQVRRYVAELDKEGVQDLPPRDLRRYAFKMATGSGKTWVMAMAVVWSYFHKKRISGSEFSTNFLIVAPNVIVYQRLEKDFASNRIFHELPLVPPEWGSLPLKVILRGEATEPDPSGNLFLTNVHHLYESRDQDWTPQNAIEALLGPKPAKDLASNERSMLERVKSLRDLVVMNDEAHHVHDEDLAWSQSLLAIQHALPAGLALWLDFSATPKDQGGMYFPWTVCEYPLAQAVEDRIVKAPIIVTKEDDPGHPDDDPDNVTADNAPEKYAFWLHAAVARWKEHWKVYQSVGQKPVLFLMVEKSVYADAIGEYLIKTKEFGFEESEVLIIHTDSTGEIRARDLDKARETARDIDGRRSKVKAIVSVMMLREGWDVRSVTVVLGLRPFTASAEILPEQVIGRGLRLMRDVGADRTQTLEVLGTKNLLRVLREQLEAEGVGVGSSKDGPPDPIKIQALRDRFAYDIAIPLTKPRMVHEIRKLSDLALAALEAIYEGQDLAETFRLRLKLEFANPQVEVHQAEIGAGAPPPAHDSLSSIATKVADRAKLPNRFAELYPIVRDYVSTRCFGVSIELDSDSVRSHLARVDLRDGIAAYLAREISLLTVERREIEFEKADFRLSDTRPFLWRRDLLPFPMEAKKTVFNYVATYNPFERRFAEFLDRAPDVLRFASLGTTQQGESNTQFKVDYLKPSGAIGFYHPDWAVVQETAVGEVNWIIETKGRVWEGTESKDEAIRDWCERVSEQIDSAWRYQRVNQREFEARKPSRLSELLAPD